MYPAVQVGPLTLPTGPLASILGFWLFLALGAREVGRKGMDGDQVYNAGFYGVLAGLIGGRIAHALRYWEAYAAQPALLVSLNVGALAVAEAVLVGLFAAWLTLRRRGVALVPLLDALAPGAALGLAVVSLGQFLSGDAFGMPADLPWSVHLWQADRHPVQVYQMLANLGIFGWLWRERDRGLTIGWQAVQFLFLYSVSRLVLDAFRAEVWLLPGGLRGTQVLALAGALFALFLAYGWAEPTLPEDKSPTAVE